MKNILQISVFMFFLLMINKTSAQTIFQQMTGKTDVIVDIKGTGNYTKIQDAINSIPDNNDAWKVIFVKKGVYYEKVILGYKKTKVILVGEDVDSTIITYDDYADKVLPGHTFSTYTFRADANDFQAYNISFQSTAGSRGQGVAFHSNGDRQILYHCKLLGDQDTYFDNFRTRRYLKDCYIEGGVDFIFGFGVTLFDSCQIHSIRGSGYITAASTPQYYEFGYVFRNCRLTGAPGVSGTSLGRPWFDWSNTVFFQCWEPLSITKAGWSPWSGREKTCFYREYNCFGPGFSPSTRLYGSQLDTAKASRYNIDTIFSANNFPSEMGYTQDTAELMHLYRRFEKSGYAQRADTILYAGRPNYPVYPSDDWKPVFNQDVYNIISNSTLRMMDSLNGKYSIEKILWNGKEINGFNPDVLTYGIEIPSEDTVTPKISVIGEGFITKITYPTVLPGKATVLITSKDGVNGKNYSLYFSKDSAFWDTELKYIIINNTDTVKCVENKYDYSVTLKPGVTKITYTTIITKVAGQMYSKTLPTSLPGVFTVDVTAVDKVTTGKYTIDINLSTSNINRDKSNVSSLVIINPVKNKLQISNNLNNTVNGELRVYDQKGSVINVTKLVQISKGTTDLNVDLSKMDEGFYFYIIKTEGRIIKGKFIKVR